MTEIPCLTLSTPNHLILLVQNDIGKKVMAFLSPVAEIVPMCCRGHLSVCPKKGDMTNCMRRLRCTSKSNPRGTM